MQTTKDSSRRAVIYVRISSDPTGRAAGVERQEEDCRALADQLGWTVVAVHPDNDISAYSGKPRPGYRNVLDDLAEHRADAVIAWHPDRLYRRLPDLAKLIDTVQAANAEIRTVRAGAIDLNTASGRMNAKILAAVSEHEVEHGIERVKAAKAQAAAQGRYRGGPRPFGYESDGTTIRETEARHIRDATNAIIAGESLRAICRDWATQGIRTVPRARRNPDGSRGEPASREWQPTELRKLLLRPRNAGLLETTVIGPDGKKHSEIAGEAQWPALVDEETWRACKSVLEGDERRTTTSNARVWLGSGLYLCGECGETVRGSTAGLGGKSKAKDGKTHRPAYRCRTAKHVTRDAPSLDRYIEDLAVERLSRPDAATLLLPPPAAEEDREDLAATANALRAKLDAFTADYAADLITRQQMLDGTALTRKRLAQVEARMEARAQRSVLASVPLGTPDVAEAWKTYHLDKKRAIVDALMTVTVLKARRGRPKGFVPGSGVGYFDPDSVTIEWKKPGS